MCKISGSNCLSSYIKAVTLADVGLYILQLLISYMAVGIGSFPGVNRPGRGANHPPPSSAEVMERVELCLNSPSRPSWPVQG